MELDTSIPPWLQRNLAPREPFDVTPWLQERYRRQVEQQKLPLQLQQMALQNEASRLGVEHQGIVNEMQGTQMMAYKDELPRFQQLVSETQGNPNAIINRVESFQSPVLQKQWLDLQTQAAKTQAGLAMLEGTKQKWIAARELAATPGVPPIQTDQAGNPSEEWLASASQAKATFQQGINEQRYGWRWTVDEDGNLIPTQEMVAKIRANAVPGAKVVPEIMEFGGRKYLVNPKTGHSQLIDQRKSKSEFIQQNALKWARDSGMTPEDAAQSLSDFYDKTSGVQSEQPQQQGPVDPKDPLGLLKKSKK